MLRDGTSSCLDFPEDSNRWPPGPNLESVLIEKNVQWKHEKRSEVTALTSSSGVLQEFSFGQIWDRTSCQRRVRENSPKHHNFRAAKKGKLQLHSLRQNILLVWDVDETHEDSENSKTPVGILAFYILKQINLFSLSVSCNWITAVRLYLAVGLSMCVCLSVHHRIPNRIPIDFVFSVVCGHSVQ